MTEQLRINDGTAKLTRDMPFAEYVKLDGISASALKGVGGISPDHLRAYIAGELERSDSDDMRFGRAMHCMILEPERFAESFPVTEQCWATLKSGPNKDERCRSAGVYRGGSRWFCGTHKGPEAVSPDDYVTQHEAARLSVLREKLKVSPANQYLARGGYSEAVITWERLGFKLKTRIDRLHVGDDAITIIDLKKCRVGAATDELIRKECHARRYDIQAAFNVDAVREIYGEDRPVEWHVLFVEDSAPFGSNLLKASEFDIERGVNEIVRQLRNYRDCEKSGQWYSYQRVIDEPHEGILPLWLSKQLSRGA